VKNSYRIIATLQIVVFIDENDPAAGLQARLVDDLSLDEAGLIVDAIGQSILRQKMDSET